MKNRFLFLAAAAAVGCTNPKPLIAPDRNNGGITLPEKFAAAVVVDTTGRGRHMAINANGDIYLHLRRLTSDKKGIIALRDTDGDGRADVQQGFSEVNGTGIEIHKGYLYYSDQTHVYRSKLSEGELLPDDQRDTVVTLVAGIGHMEKPFTFDGKGAMYVTVGSMSNACEQPMRTPASPGANPCTELETRAGIWAFADDKTGQVQDLSNRYATGIRNAVALMWNAGVDRLFAVQHGRDDLHRYWPDLYTEHENQELPSEIFFDLEKGDDMGWPYCYYDHIKGVKLMNPEYGGDGQKADLCSTAKDPLLGFPGHWAPNDILFYQGDLFPERYKHGAFIAFHGSWNRLGGRQQGFNVVFVPMKDGKPSGPWEVFANGFIGPDPITNPANAHFRPCGLAEGPDGSLYISDSQHGRIWRVLYYKDGVPESVDRALYQPTSAEPAAVAVGPGKAVYDTYCVACHMDNGLGAPGMNPPLAGTEIVNGDPSKLIDIVLNGFKEPTVINGELYQNVMPAQAFLTDQQIADVLTFVRSSFGNSAGAVSADDVSRKRSPNQ
jgi:glucose/arabinose dehydrogenase/mono/diheme cytochrome c family protein